MYLFEKVLEKKKKSFQRYKFFSGVVHTSTKINGIKRNDSLLLLCPCASKIGLGKLPSATLLLAKNDPISAQMAIFMALK